MRDLAHAAHRLHEIFRLARRKQIDFVAGGITYYEFFALAPLVLLAFTVLSLFAGTGVAEDIILAADAFLPATATEVLRSILQDAGGSTTLISALIFVWAGIQLFRSFDIAFSEIYETQHAETLIEELEDAFTALITLSVAILITLAAIATLSSLSGVRFAGLLWVAAQFSGLTILFIPFYHVFTERSYPVRHLLPGALVAAAGWTLLQTLFQQYALLVGGSLYAVFGGLLLLIIWMYVGNVLILLGAVVNMVHITHQQDED